MIDAPENSPVARAPGPLRAAVEGAAAALNADPSHGNWTLLQASVQACIDHDDRNRDLARPAA